LKRLSSANFALCFLLCLLPPLFARGEATVTLITCGPGDEVWEKFGHNMLWVHDPERGIDYAYNWGLFDFDQPNFIGNFIRGRMVYWMDGWEPRSALGPYWQQKRLVTMQRLNLTPQQIDKMARLCEENRQPANASYKYDYFRDNCSTRVRDMIDDSSDGQFRKVLEAAKPSGLSYRQHAMRLMQDDFWLSLGIDFCLGPRVDVPLTPWQECFLPARLSTFAAPMAVDTWNPWESNRPAEPENVPNRVPLLGITGVVLAGLLLLASRFRAGLGRWFLGIWWLISGFGGCFLIFAQTTDHWASHWNQNILHFSPLAIVALGLLIERGRRTTLIVGGVAVLLSAIAAVLFAGHILPMEAAPFITLLLPINIALVPAVIALWLRLPNRRAAARGVAIAIVVISVIALLLHLVGVLTQANGGFIALSLPLDLAAIFVVRPPRLTPAPAASELPAE